MDNARMSTPLNRQQGDLLHRQLFLALREQIRRGVYPEGSTIPPEDQLGRMFGVSRITVRRAVSELVDAGWVEKRMGRGTFVLANGPRPEAQPALTFVESLMQRSRQTQLKVLEMGLRAPPAEVAAALGLAADQPTLFASRLRSVGDVPLIVTDAWLVSRHAKHVTPEKLRRQGLSEILLNSGVMFASVTQTITAVAADPHVASLLRVEVGSPLLRVVRLVKEKPKAPLMQLTAYLSSERSAIVFELDAGDLDSPHEGRLVHHVPK